MNQSRLEKLRKLLNERRGNAKRSCDKELDGENFNAQNFEAENSDNSKSDRLNLNASNFHASDLNDTNSKSLNSDASNLDDVNSKVSNSKSLNSALDALNLESKIDQNSTAKDNAEQQNFISDDSGALSQNSKTRDYDKEPIIIKDHTYYEFMIYQFPALLIGFIIFFTFATIVNPVSLKTFRMLPFILVSLLTVIRDKDGMYFEFRNDKILYYKNKIHKIFELSSIGAMIISLDCRHSMRTKGKGL